MATMTQSVATTELSSGPRIYNLFPLLAGPVAAWAEHTRAAWEDRLDRLEAHLHQTPDRTDTRPTTETT